ncbi:uncharacterized protein [Bos taurus]|uniref:uncharacterized protein isoform X3 n=1 Tax=Bos taurus TaxID=9913 RepID=UPI0028CB6480|nr:uncharacterized protein LOC132342715 isoform X3 [Bos taurus]
MAQRSHSGQQSTQPDSLPAAPSNSQGETQNLSSSTFRSWLSNQDSQSSPETRRVSIQEPLPIIHSRRVSIQDPQPSTLTRRVSIQEPLPIIHNRRVSIQDPQPSTPTRRVSIQDPQPSTPTRRVSIQDPQPSTLTRRSPTQYRGHDACHRLSPGQHPRPTIRHLQPPVPPPRRSPSFPKSPLQQPKPPANYSHPSDQHKISDLPQPTKCPGSQVKSSKLHVTSPGQSRRPPLNYSQSRGQYQKRRVNCLDLPGDHQRLFEQLPNQPVHPGKQRSELTIGLLREQCWQPWIHFQVPLAPLGDPGFRTIPIDTVFVVRCSDMACLHEYDQNAYLLDFAWAFLLVASITNFILCIILINIIFSTNSNVPLLDFSNVIITALTGTALRPSPEEPSQERPKPVLIPSPSPPRSSPTSVLALHPPTPSLSPSTSPPHLRTDRFPTQLLQPRHQPPRHLPPPPPTHLQFIHIPMHDVRSRPHAHFDITFFPAPKQSLLPSPTPLQTLTPKLHA